MILWIDSNKLSKLNKMKQIAYLILVILIISFSCNKENFQDQKAHSYIGFDFNGTYYFFNDDGIINIQAIISTDANGNDILSIIATDPKTVKNEFDKRFRILITTQGAEIKNYQFPTEATVDIYFPTESLNEFPDLSSYDGYVSISKIGSKGDYIKGVFIGKFKDSQLGNGLPYQDWPLSKVEGSFKIYRIQ